MRNIILFILLIQSISSIGQNEKDTINFSAGLLTYPFAYNTEFESGSVATGPSFSLNDGNISFQAGIMQDFKQYQYYDHPVHGQTTLIKDINVFVPLLFYYSFYQRKKISCFAAGGFMLAGRYYMMNNITHTTSGFSLIGGSGISWKFLKRFNLKLFPTLRYSGEIFTGILIDLSGSFNIIQTKI